MTVRHHPAREHADVIDAGTQLIDVRQPDEVATGTIPGAVNIPLDQLPARIDELDRTRRVVLLCRSGRRSDHAAELLVAAGFGDVVNLDGGVLGCDPQTLT
ncbi:MAG: rhodanese-like domain-containing protein [Ilumatobacteraceae bacterium]